MRKAQYLELGKVRFYLAFRSSWCYISSPSVPANASKSTQGYTGGVASRITKPHPLRLRSIGAVVPRCPRGQKVVLVDLRREHGYISFMENTTTGTLHDTAFHSPPIVGTLIYSANEHV